MEFTLCIEPVLTNSAFVDRIARVAEMGFTSIEFWEPGDKDLDAVRAACNATGVRVNDCTFNDGWGNTRLHAETDAVVANFRATIPMLQKLSCSMAICLTGEAQADRSGEEQKARVIDNLKALAPLAAEAGIIIVLEALNSLVDHPGYFLDSAQMGFEILRAVDHPNVKLLYDVYHMQIMEGNIVSTVKDNIDLIGHFHAAGVPGRHELYTGELDYRHIIDAVASTGYTGAFGLEFFPSEADEQSLRKTAEFLGLTGGTA